MISVEERVYVTFNVFRFAWTIFHADVNPHTLTSRTPDEHICADYLWIKIAKIDKNRWLKAIYPQEQVAVIFCNVKSSMGPAIFNFGRQGVV